MSFFDKQQEVLDVKLTQFGKNLLARGAFKPTYYQFFDDGVVYNSERAGFSELQNRSEERIFEAPYIKSLHTVSSVEKSYDNFENEINSGNVDRFMEIRRQQDPLISEKILQYPLNNSYVNSQQAPRFKLLSLETEPDSMSEALETSIAQFRIPQVNYTCIYEIMRNDLEAIPQDEVNDLNSGTRSYFDLTSEKIKFLDNSYLEVKSEDIAIDLEEFNTYDVLDNFEIEVYEVVKDQNYSDSETLIRVEEEATINSLFEITIDHEVMETRVVDQKHERAKSDRR